MFEQSTTNGDVWTRKGWDRHSTYFINGHNYLLQVYLAHKNYEQVMGWEEKRQPYSHKGWYGFITSEHFVNYLQSYHISFKNF